MLDPDVTSELQKAGADPLALIAQARTSRATLTDTLKELGFSKLGARKITATTSSYTKMYRRD